MFTGIARRGRCISHTGRQGRARWRRDPCRRPTHPIEMNRHQLSLAERLAPAVLVIASLATATLFTWFERQLARDTMYVFFVGAVAVTSWRDGWKWGLLTAAAAVLLVDFVFIEPAASLRIVSMGSVSRVVSFALVALLVILLTKELHDARRRADDLAREASARQAAAEQDSAARREFLNTLSHEVRTPINAILGYLGLLDSGATGAVSPDQRAFFERMRTATNHLLNVVNDVLDLARAESGHLELTVRPCPVLRLVDSALALTEPQAHAKRIDIDVAVREKDADCLIDEDRTRQILVNVIGNAVKFTPQGGHIVISWHDPMSDRSGRLGVAVRDNGPGIDASEHEQIFEPFKQTAEGKRLSGSSGLGLAISRQLARMQGGDLIVESARGHGATFTLWVRCPPNGEVLARS